MGKDRGTNCPICKSSQATRLLNLDCGNFDHSNLYRFVKINACEKCGHIYNRLSPQELRDLKKYYSEEYGQINLNSTDKIGDRPGSTNSFTSERHSLLYGLIAPYISKDSKILDIGCAMGGFLDYLYQKGITKLYGIDIIKDYVNYAKKKGNYTVKLGGAESIPFEDGSLDLVVADQVIEHLIRPDRIFREARRVLTEGGLLCIGVPDASRYNKSYFFDFFWFLMREHIQHFDIAHLKLLAEMEGFELVAFEKVKTIMMSKKMILPNLNVIFRRIKNFRQLNITKKCFKLKKEAKVYIANNLKKLNQKRVIIGDLTKSQKPLYVWGVSREFLYLYESVGLKNCNIVGLIDVNSYKQNKYSVGGKKITSSIILKNTISDSVLLISAVAHTEQIEKTLVNMGYNGQILDI